MAVKANQPVDATIVIAQVTTTDDFTATIQLLGENGKALTDVGAVAFYMCTDDAGQVLAVTSTDVVSLAIGTDGLAIETSANVAGWLVSESDGAIDLAIEIADNKDAYLVLIMPDGRLVISDQMAYTA